LTAAIVIVVFIIVIGCIACGDGHVFLLDVGIISGGLGNSCQSYRIFKCCVCSTNAIVVVIVIVILACGYVVLLDAGMVLKAGCVVGGRDVGNSVGSVGDVPTQGGFGMFLWH